jgi:hypothetical protein
MENFICNFLSDEIELRTGRKRNYKYKYEGKKELPPFQHHHVLPLGPP